MSFHHRHHITHSNTYILINSFTTFNGGSYGRPSTQLRVSMTEVMWWVDCDEMRTADDQTTFIENTHKTMFSNYKNKQKHL